MLITRENYEVFFIDYIDGNLSPEEKAMLSQFIEQNPDLAAELEGLNQISLEKINVKYENRDSLKKTSFGMNGVTTEFDYLCIAENEGDISDEESVSLNKYLYEKPLLTKEKDLYGKTILKPDKAITYPHKSSIKRTLVIGIKQNTFRSIISVAAGLLILFGLFSVFDSVKNTEKVLATDGNQVAVTNAPDINQIDEKQIIVQEKNEPKVVQGISEVQHFSEKVLPKQDLAEPQNIVITAEPEQLSIIKPKGFNSFETHNPRIALLDIPQNNSPEKNLDNTIVKEDKPQERSRVSSRTIDLFDIFQIGVNKLAYATGSSMQLTAEKDPNGKIKKIKFDSKLFALSTPLKRNN